MIKVFTVFSIILMLLSLSVYAQRDEETAMHKETKKLHKQFGLLMKVMQQILPEKM